ncbi:hypothetical protein, partial [Fulvivirga aurantia]|uniref:hypothetical protein n=1 Tax=Fulvivirga aurantia TaxID=2529383 RepID=UPI0012BB7679
MHNNTNFELDGEIRDWSGDISIVDHGHIYSFDSWEMENFWSFEGPCQGDVIMSSYGAPSIKGSFGTTINLEKEKYLFGIDGVGELHYRAYLLTEAGYILGGIKKFKYESAILLSDVKQSTSSSSITIHTDIEKTGQTRDIIDHGYVYKIDKRKQSYGRCGRDDYYDDLPALGDDKFSLGAYTFSDDFSGTIEGLDQ